MVETKVKLLADEELFADATATLARRINWTNNIRKWILETPSFFPYFRSWYRGRDVVDTLLSYPMNNVAGLVSNNREALKKTISLMREKNPNYDPIAMIDPQSELLYLRYASAADRKAAFESGAIPKNISSLISNRLRAAKNGKAENYNELLMGIYDPDTCAGWLDDNIRKSIAAGARIAVPLLPLIVDDESRIRWKEAYLALKRLYVKTDDIEGKAGIPLALHIPLHQKVFKEGKEGLVAKILEDMEELHPTMVTTKVAFGVQLKDEKNPERAQNTENFLENVGRTCKAFNIPVHLFCENEDGVYAYKLGISMFSQPIDGKVLRQDFYPVEPPTLEQKFGRIYHYGHKNRVTHKTWLTESEGIDAAPCGLPCCKGKTYGLLGSMGTHAFYHYAGKHLLVTRNQEISEVIQAIRASQLMVHFKSKYNR